jgi:predicted nucleotide-binding protein (sugar kinase/HSP70/actin superfamily)
MKIGIPKALIYWKRPYFWESFFENLGFDVLLSPKTNKEIVEMGVKASDPETCFSVKVFFGHLLWLEGKCDFIFVPRLKTNKEKLEYCPKFFGLPDLAKIAVKTKILTETFDEIKENRLKALERLGKKLNKNKREIQRATEISEKREKEREEEINKNFFEKINSNKPKIVLISHPYNLQDEYVNLRLEEKLKELGAEAIFIDEVPISANRFTPLDKLSNGASQHKSAPSINFHWEFGKEIMEKIDSLFLTSGEKNFRLSGAIEISAFACGCDSVLKEFVEKKFKENKIPFLYLIIDEHTGEAGFQTRLEAFLDTLGS